MECVTAVLLILLLFTFPFVSGNKISCTSPRDAVEGDSVSIVCHYFTNIERDKLGFYVYRYPPDSKDPEVAAICNWTEDTLHCEVLPGYEVNVDDDTVILNVTSVRTDHAGRYSCRILTPGEDVHLETCHLNVHGRKDKTAQRTTPTDAMSMDCHAQRHGIQGMQTVTCIVPESLNSDIITIERHDLGDDTKTVEILRCSKEDACIVNVDGYKVRRKYNPQEGYRVLVALVEKHGQYVCTAQGTVTQSCTMGIIKDQDKSVMEVSSPQVLVILVCAFGVFAILLLATLVVVLIRSKKRQRHKETKKTDVTNGQESYQLVPSTTKEQHQSNGGNKIS